MSISAKKGDVEMKRTVLVKYVHSCFASLATGDVLLYMKVEKHIKISEYKISEVTGDNMLKVLYVESDKIFYDRALHSSNTIGVNFSKTDEFLKLIARYKKEGWSTRKPKELIDYYKREDLREKQKRQRSKFLFVEYVENRPAQQFQGGFSDKVFKSKRLYKYVNSDGVFGYMGHYVRKVNIDRYIEKKFLSLKPKVEVNLVDLLTCWLTSSDGRHFGDSLGGLSFAQQRKKIDENIYRMFNISYIYASPKHEGSYASTKKLQEEFKDVLYTENSK